MSRFIKPMSFNPMTILLWGSVLIGLYWLYQKVLTPFARVENSNDKVIAETATDYMANGRTYYNVADELFNSMYHILFGIFYTFSIKNTDEATLGRLMLTVKRDEFQRLADVYSMIKRRKGVDSDPLFSDLTRTFSKSEQKQFLSHLNQLQP